MHLAPAINRIINIETISMRLNFASDFANLSIHE